MEFWELLILALGLSMDAFAVSVCKGLSMKRLDIKCGLIIALAFGTAHSIMLLVGWIIGSQLENIINKYDHIIAFVLLTFIGGKMIFEALTDKEDEVKNEDRLNLREILLLSLATSVDVLAVGITFAFLPNVSVGTSAIVIGIVVFFMSLTGVVIGNKWGGKLNNKAEVFGGVILIFIGLKILLEHLGVIAF